MKSGHTMSDICDAWRSKITLSFWQTMTKEEEEEKDITLFFKNSYHRSDTF